MQKRHSRRVLGTMKMTAGAVYLQPDDSIITVNIVKRKLLENLRRDYFERNAALSSELESSHSALCTRETCAGEYGVAFVQFLSLASPTSPRSNAPRSSRVSRPGQRRKRSQRA
jgi:hypothetical protein